MYLNYYKNSIKIDMQSHIKDAIQFYIKHLNSNENFTDLNIPDNYWDVTNFKKLIIDYVDYLNRFILPINQKVVYEERLLKNLKFKQYKTVINQIKSDIEYGRNINKRLSKKVFNNYFAKDATLQYQAINHLHLGKNNEERTNDLLLFSQDRENLTIYLLDIQEHNKNNQIKSFCNIENYNLIPDSLINKEIFEKLSRQLPPYTSKELDEEQQAFYKEAIMSGINPCTKYFAKQHSCKIFLGAMTDKSSLLSVMEAIRLTDILYALIDPSKLNPFIFNSLQFLNKKYKNLIFSIGFDICLNIIQIRIKTEFNKEYIIYSHFHANIDILYNIYENK